MIKILFFARLKDQLNQESLVLDQDFSSIKELQQFLIVEHKMSVLDDETIRVALNQKFCQPEQKLRAGDEVAFMPPVTGG